jgi:hypothetical protein
MLMEILCRAFRGDKGQEYGDNGKTVAEVAQHHEPSGVDDQRNPKISLTFGNGIE